MEIINSTDKALRVYEINYRDDSTKICNYHLLCKKPCTVNHQSSWYNESIRIDIIAVDESKNDTVYIKSFPKELLNNETLTVTIENKSEKLPPDFVTLPFLKINATGYEIIRKVSEPLSIKLHNQKKIQGILKSFDKESITLEDSQKTIVVIQKKELAGIKICEPVWAILKTSFTHYCKYSRLRNVQFENVHQVPVMTMDKALKYEWKKIKT